MKAFKEALAMISLAFAIMIVIIGMVLLAANAKAETAYVRPVHEWSPHVAPQAYKAPRHIRRIQRAARREKRERVRIWTPPIRHVAKVHRPALHSISEDGTACLRPVSAIGTEATTFPNAKAHALIAWRALVNHRFGTRYSEPTNIKFRCGVARTGSTATEKVLEGGRKFLNMEATNVSCSILAEPCMPPIEESGAPGMEEKKQ